MRAKNNCKDLLIFFLHSQIPRGTFRSFGVCCDGRASSRGYPEFLGCLDTTANSFSVPASGILRESLPSFIQNPIASHGRSFPPLGAGGCMSRGFGKGVNPMKWPQSNRLFACAFLVLAVVFCDVHAASALPISKVMAIPAFARKYGLPCSACHTAWPELNNFGQVFRDNGYQLMNDRDSPIWQNPSYFPITFRITPAWHRESTDHQAIDSIPGGGAGSTTVSGKVTQAGFDLSGMDLWSAGTLYKNISFVLLPSSDPTAVWHFESAWVRLDNIKGTSWLNFKFGRFELDNLISEKRFLFLSANGGIYQTFHFDVPGSINDFGIGDNQIGM